MKIYVISLRSIKRTVALILLLAISVSVTLGLIFVTDTYAYPAISNALKKTEIDTVILDAGHGGEDCGAIGTDGTYEKDLNLAVAIEMRRLLEERGYKVVMTRDDDKMLYSEGENIKGMRKLSDLKNRCKIAAQHENAIFVSIHMNSFGDAKYSGLQVYYSNGNDNSRALAEAIQKQVRADLQPDNDRTVKNGKDLYILDNCPITAVIVECGFLSNAEECKKLSEKEYQNRLSLAMVCGIIEYIGSD